MFHVFSTAQNLDLTAKFGVKMRLKMFNFQGLSVNLNPIAFCLLEKRSQQQKDPGTLESFSLCHWTRILQ